MTAYGVDLGTTISSIGHADEDGHVTLFSLRDGSPRLRSVVTIDDDGVIKVGDEAQRLAPLDPDSSFSFFKRSMGTSWKVAAGDRTWTAPQLSVHMLQGEAQRPLDTNPLGRWTFERVPGHRRGHVDVDVSYAYDEHGVVHVSAAVKGRPLDAPVIDRDDRDLRWTDEDPGSHAALELAVALVIDISGSMAGSKLQEAKDACCGFVDTLEEAGVGECVALVAFGSSGRLMAGLGTIVRDGGEIIARGVQGANQAFLRELATGGGELLGAGELVSSFRGIAQQLAAAGGRGGLGRAR